jgi:DNA repair photolyase
MVTVIRSERRSAVLTSSDLPCLSTMPTVNLTAGCLHDCAYCYIRGYSNYPGESTAVLYEDTPDRLERELTRRRSLPRSVYFSPSSDLFQPAPEVLECAERVLRILFDREVGVAFLTKGHIPEHLMSLLVEHARLVQAQVGLISVDERVTALFEPHAATASERLQQIREMIEGGIKTEVRIDPILPGVTDGLDALEDLFAAIETTGVRHAAAGVLFLRPRITGSLRRNVTDPAVLRRLLDLYEQRDGVSLRGGGTSIEAPVRAQRLAIFERARERAEAHGIELSICACKNPDIAKGRCNIAGTWASRPRRSARQISMPV